MRFFSLNLVLCLVVLLSSCDIGVDDVPNSGIPTSTPFQPQPENLSDSPYSAAAPTPLNLPTLTPLPNGPTEAVPASESLPADFPTLITSPNLNPLTGLEPSDLNLLNRRPMAIKVANYPRYIRPQSGLTLADNIYEYYIEDGLTRFIAVFYGNNSEWVGPVRSGRYFDEHIQRMYQAYLVFKFADPREMNHFLLSDFYDFLVVPGTGSCPPFRLMESRNIEVYNNSYFNTLLWEDCILENGLDNQRPQFRSGLFSDIVPQADLAGTQMFTDYSVDSYHYWVYQPETQSYVRYQEVADTRDNKPEKYDLMVDAVTERPVTASNIVYLLASHTFTNSFDEDDEVFKIDLTGSGEAYVFRDGVGIVARWYRLNQDQPLLLAGVNGAPIYLRPGVTFYEVLGARSFVDQGDGEWHFHHDVP